MDATEIHANEHERLNAIRDRVRELALNHVWFADAIRAAFEGILDLWADYYSRQLAQRARERTLARELLSSGRIVDPTIDANSRVLSVIVSGACPVALANRLRNHRRSDAMPRNLERESAAASLAALDREDLQREHEPSASDCVDNATMHAAKIASTHVPFMWKIVVPLPDNWQEPINPFSLERSDLERLAEADFRTIALFRLGALADVGNVRPLVAKPNETGDKERDFVAYAAWRSRLPIDNDQLEKNEPVPDTRALPPYIAEQFMGNVETWASGEAAKRISDDNAEYRPASWFSKSMPSRLRQAASKNRKSKRVATRKIDGVVCYSVADVRRWWPRDVPK
ncbi:MAG: hypothetical protein HUU18_10950 [Phycisphaerales bacterium]|nr:hypothetical protein [Phycisphaerales bacterium]